MQHRTYAYRIPWTKWSGLVIVASGEVLACFRLRGGLSGKLRLDSSAKHCALLSVFGSRSIVFVLLSPGRIPSELLVVSAAGGLSVRGVQKSSVTCQIAHSSLTQSRRAATPPSMLARAPPQKLLGALWLVQKLARVGEWQL